MPGEGWSWSVWPRALSLKSVRGRMALLLGLAMLPAGAIAMQAGANAVAVRQAAIEEQLERRALDSIRPEQKLIGELRELLRVLATAPALQAPLGAQECRAWMDEVFAEYPYISALALMERDGRLRCSRPESPNADEPNDSPLIAKARARDAFTVGFVEAPRLSYGSTVAAIEPLRDARNVQIGLIGVSVPTGHLQQMLERSRALDGVHSAIVDSEGRVIAESVPQPTSGAPPALPSRAQMREHLGPDPSFVRTGNGAAVVAPLHAPDLYIAVSWRPETQTWRQWLRFGFSVVAPILIWLLAVAAGWFAIEFFVARPLTALETMARGFARGEDVRDTPTLLTGAPEEIRNLRRTLAAMAKTLRGRELRLAEALREERALLREVHHRVKNNLQMVASLLNIQARNANDEAEARGLSRAHDRVQLLSLAHQRIYASGEVRDIRLDELAAEIARNLVSASTQQGGQALVDLKLDEAHCNVDQAVPLAFLIGEGLSNALDVLSERRDARILLHLSQEPDGALVLEIEAADAPDMPDTQASTGGRLIEAFARQLGAEITRDAQRPFALRVRVPASVSDAH